MRGVRKIERAAEANHGPVAEAVLGYCSAVRSALADDGRPPLQAAGPRLHQRLSAISASAERVEKRGRSRPSCRA